MRLLFWLFGRAIHRHIADELLRPEGFSGMQLAFRDPEGKHAYWSWMDISDLSPVRQKHIERCMRMSDAGIGERTLDELCGMAEIAILDGLKATKPDERSKKAARATQLVGEIRNRPKDIIPEEVWYDMCAVFAVRDDEDPRSFDPSIHQQKIDMLSKAGRAGHDFFTRLPAFRKVLGSSLTTVSAYIELLSGWAAQRARLRAVREVSGN